MRAPLVAALCLLTACAGRLPGSGSTHNPVDAAWDRLLRGDSAGGRAALEKLAAEPAADVRALYGVALLAHEHGELERAFSAWLRLLGDAGLAASPWAALAEVAAHKLDALALEAGDARGRAAALARLDPARLPAAVRRRLLGTQALLARRIGDEAAARRFEEERGCPAAWRVAGPIGRLPRLNLDLANPRDGGPLAGDAVAPARACRVTVPGRSGRPGVSFVGGFVSLDRDADAAVVVDTDEPFRLLIDGREVFRSLDVDRYPPRTQALAVRLAAGVHRLQVKISAGLSHSELGLEVHAERARLVVSTDPPPGRAGTAPGPAQRIEPSWPAQPVGAAALLARYARAQLAISNGDPGTVDEQLPPLLAAAPRFALAQLVQADAAAGDPTRPSRFAQDRTRRSLERALNLDAGLLRARINLAQVELQAERAARAVELLDAAPPADRAEWRLAYMRHLAFKQRGWAREADQALDQALAQDAEACAALTSEVERRRERYNLSRALTAAERAAGCPDGGLLRAEVLRNRGDLAGADQEYRRLLELQPGRESARAGHVEVLRERGQVEAAAAALRLLLARDPKSVVYRQKLADLELGRGRLPEARRILVEGLAEVPESQELAHALRALCLGRPPAERSGASCRELMDPFRLDTRAVIADYLANLKAGRSRYTSPAVIVLNRTVVRVFATGARLTLTHNIVQVLAKDGIDKWGEVKIPEGADLLTLRAIKADGSTREPEEIGEKEAVSLPDLEVGDFVEFEYIDPAGPPAAFPGGFLAERFYFGTFDAPLDRTEYVLVTPPAMELQLDVRGDAPTAVVSHHDGLAVHTWARRRRPQLFAEPEAPPPSEYLGSVRVGAGLSLAVWRDYLRDQTLLVGRASAALREVAERETRGAATPAAKLERLDAWVRRHVEHGGSLDEAASHVLAKEQGNRVTLLGALLRVAGVPSELWLARSDRAALLDGPLPDLEAFEQPLLAAAGRLVNPRYRHSPAGFVSPNLRGQAALAVRAGALSLERVPEASNNRRRMELDIRLRADGGAEVRARERLRGWPALEWREGIDRLAPDRIRPQFEQHTLGFYFPGAALADLKWQGLDDDAGELVVEYRFDAPQLARRGLGALVLPAPYPALLGRRYAGMAVRRSPLVLDYAAPTEIEARIELGEGAGAVAPEPEVVLRGGPFGDFVQRTERVAGGLRLRAEFALRSRRVAPADYPALVDFALRVDRAEAKVATVVTSPPKADAAPDQKAESVPPHPVPPHPVH